MKKDYIARSLIIALLNKYYSGDQIKKNDIGKACSMYVEEAMCKQGFGGGNLRKKRHLEDPGIDGRKILKRKVGRVGADLIELAQGRDRCRAILNTKHFLTS